MSHGRDSQPALENRLKRLYWDEAVRVIELVQLRRNDARAIAADTVPDADIFYGKRPKPASRIARGKTHHATVFLSIHLQKQQKGSLQQRGVSLYEAGCEQLCTEINDGRLAMGETGLLTPRQRLVVAARIAATTVFSDARICYMDSALDRGNKTSF